MTHQSLDLTCNMEMMFPSIKTLNCLVVWNMNFMNFHVYIYTWNNNPNWRTHIFQRGSNHQLLIVLYIWHPIWLQKIVLVSAAGLLPKSSWLVDLVSWGLQEDVMPRFVTSDDQPVSSMKPGSMLETKATNWDVSCLLNIVSRHCWIAC